MAMTESSKQVRYEEENRGAWERLLANYPKSTTSTDIWVTSFTDESTTESFDGAKTFLPLREPHHLEAHNADLDMHHARIETDQKLCRTCTDALAYYCYYISEARKATEESLSNTVLLHADIHQMRQAAEEGCFLCSKLCDFFPIYNRFSWKPSEHWDSNALSACAIEMSWERDQAHEVRSEQLLIFSVTQPRLERAYLNYFNFLQMRRFHTEEAAELFAPPTSQITEAECSQAELSESSYPRNSAAYRSLASQWLSRCVQDEHDSHVGCNSTDYDWLPSQLLDVEHASKTSCLRFVELNAHKDLPDAGMSRDNRFVTLSHCWGKWGAEALPKLTNANFEERKKSGISLQDLPQTFQDAVEIARWFDVKWLWVDSLCIKQDSFADWYREAENLAHIYQTAFLNISADAAEDARGGCFPKSEPVRQHHFELRVTNTSDSWRLTEDDVFMFSRLRRGLAFNRAWIYRERQLVRRVLHFTVDEMFWECCGDTEDSFASETFPNGVPYLDTHSGESMLQLINMGPSSETSHHSAWNAYCSKLSAKLLSNPSDMPLILSTLAKAFSHNDPDDGYAGGLWQSTLPQGLLWKTLRPVGKPLRRIAPSWSWVAAVAPVELRESYRQHAVTTFSDINLFTLYEDTFGQLDKSYIVLKGLKRQVRLRNIRRPHLDATCDIDLLGDEQRPITMFRDAEDTYRCRLFLDHTMDADEIQCFCMFITIRTATGISASTHTSRKISALLLHPSQYSSEYIRIGMIELDDLYSLKLRYKIREGVDDDEDRWLQLQNQIIARQDAIYNIYEQDMRVMHDIEKNEREFKRIADENTARYEGKYGIAGVLYQFEMSEELDTDWLDVLEVEEVVIT